MTQHNHARLTVAFDRDATAALERFDLPAYLAEKHGCKMTGDGDQLRCAAAWRGGDDPEKVHLDRKPDGWLWHDHKLQQGGNAITFLTEIDGLTKPAAWDLVRERAGLARVAPQERSRRAGPRQQVTGRWTYTDENGTPVSRTVRLEPGRNGKRKDYFQEVPDGKGGWHTYKGVMKDVPRVPYRLPEVLAADGLVYVVEGEKNAESLRAGGLVATCNVGGAGKWTREHASHLAGKAVVVLGDNDEPGRDHVAQVIKSLVGVAASIKAPQLAGLGEKDDVTDWLKAGHTIDDLRELVAATPEWSGEAEAPELGDDLDDDDQGDDDDRRRSPRRAEAGNVRANLDTVSLALQAMRDELGTIYQETFSGTLRVTPGPVLGGDDRPFGDLEALRVTLYLQREHHMARATDDLVYKAAVLVGNENARNALTDWLDGLAWDGVERLATWMVSAYGVDDTMYTRRVGWNWLVSMVARAYKPGAKVDTMPILEGDQGIRKSDSLRALAGALKAPQDSLPWQRFVDTHFEPEKKDFYLTIQGRWLVEIAELHGLQKAEREAIKQFLSRQVDPVRPPYGRVIVNKPRTCVMVGTTNETEYLADPTGARRFWPIKCRHVDVEWIEAHRDQLWAEAVAMYRKGSTWWEVPNEAQAEQEARRVSHPWEGLILRWLNDAGRRDRREFTVDEILTGAVQLLPGQLDTKAQMALANILKPLGWEKRRTVLNGVRAPHYFRPQA